MGRIAPNYKKGGEREKKRRKKRKIERAAYDIVISRVLRLYATCSSTDFQFLALPFLPLIHWASRWNLGTALGILVGIQRLPINLFVPLNVISFYWRIKGDWQISRAVHIFDKETKTSLLSWLRERGVERRFKNYWKLFSKKWDRENFGELIILFKRIKKKKLV